jgi:hypothetical protein
MRCSIVMAIYGVNSLWLMLVDYISPDLLGAVSDYVVSQSDDDWPVIVPMSTSGDLVLPPRVLISDLQMSPIFHPPFCTLTDNDSHCLVDPSLYNLLGNIGNYDIFGVRRRSGEETITIARLFQEPETVYHQAMNTLLLPYLSPDILSAPGNAYSAGKVYAGIGDFCVSSLLSETYWDEEINAYNHYKLFLQYLIDGTHVLRMPDGQGDGVTWGLSYSVPQIRPAFRDFGVRSGHWEWKPPPNGYSGIMPVSLGLALLMLTSIKQREKRKYA